MNTGVPDFCTVLTHAKLPLAKTWQPDGSITPYSTARYFKTRAVPLTCFNDLVALLQTLENSPRSCVIRGKYKGAEYASLHEEEHQPGLTQRQKELHEDAPHHWALIEVDEFEPISCDPVTEPTVAIDEYISTSLPPEFHEACYYWQLSNSAGHPKNAGKLKAHLWFWLQTPYTSEQLRAWGKGAKIPLDVSVFDPIQVHYTARPQFAEGVLDPVPQRSGSVLKEAWSVPLTISDSYPSSPSAGKPTKRQMLETTYQADPLAQRLFDRAMVKATGKAGELFIDCPCADDHTGASTETTTLYYPANTGGYAEGHFKCLHAHCVDKAQTEFSRALGFTPDTDFDEVETPPELPGIAKAIKAIGADRFKGVPCHLFAVDVAQAWLIKKILPAAELIVMYGASGSGKSFIAIDMACAIARGTNWREFKVAKKGRVAYICAEGAGGFRRRLRAYSLHHGIPLEDIDVIVFPHSPNLLKGDDVRDLIRALHAEGPFALVIIDTLARATAGGNENSSEDMGTAIDQARVISEVLHTTVMFIHHSGKDDSKGARGHSSLRAASDAEIEVARNGDDRCVSLGKQKDDEDELDCGFKLVQLQIGEDEDGDPITSCAVDHQRGGDMSRVKNRKKNKGPNELLLLDAFNEVCLSPEQGVSELEVIDKAIALKGEPGNAKARANMKTNFIRALKTLCRDEILLSIDGMVTSFAKDLS